MPESKKRKKNTSQRKPSAPPVAKAELAKKKKPMSRQQIGIIVISVLVILSMAVGFLFSGSSGSQPASQSSSTGQETLVSTPAPDSAAPTVAPADEKAPADATSE